MDRVPRFVVRKHQYFWHGVFWHVFSYRAAIFVVVWCHCNNSLCSTGKSGSQYTDSVLRLIRSARARPYVLLLFLFILQREISAVSRPIAAKLCHMIGNGCNFKKIGPKFGVLSAKKLGQKNVLFWRDFGRLRTLIANISELNFKITLADKSWIDE